MSEKTLPERIREIIAEVPQLFTHGDVLGRLPPDMQRGEEVKAVSNVLFKMVKAGRLAKHGGKTYVRASASVETPARIKPLPAPAMPQTPDDAAASNQPERRRGQPKRRNEMKAADKLNFRSALLREREATVRKLRAIEEMLTWL